MTSNDIFMFGPPPCDTPVDTRRFSPKIKSLVKQTHHLIEQPTLCYAIHKGEDDEQALLEAYRKAFEENCLGYEYQYVTRGEGETQIEFLAQDQNLDALEGHEIHRGVDYDGLVNWMVVSWSQQTGFFCKTIKIQYGNCPYCYSAHAMGLECPKIVCAEAGNNETCQLFITPPGVKLTSRPAASKACDPLALARLLEVKASVSLDAMTFKKGPQDVPASLEEVGIEYYGYRPDSPELWQYVDLRKIISRIDFASRPYIEHDLQRATKLPISTIEEVVDDYKTNNPDKFTENLWTTILRARKLPRGVIGH